MGFVWLNDIQWLNPYKVPVIEVMMEMVTRLSLSGNHDLNNSVILNLGYLF